MGRLRLAWGIAALTAVSATWPALHAQQARLPNTTLALPPDLPSGSFATEDAFPGLLFLDPIAFAFPPGESRRLFVVEQIGRISLIPDSAAPTRETFLDITDRVRSNTTEEGLLGLAFHPDYHAAGQPGWGSFFVCYTTTVNGQRHWRVSRFFVSADDPDRAVADSETPLITQRDRLANHNGGDVHFGPDGYLYVSSGDEGGGGDPNDHGQRIDKDFFASVLRLDVDLREGSLDPNPHPAIHPGTYRIPPDNPFVGATHFNGLPVNPADVRTEFWAIGLRNPWRMNFDPPTGRLYVADVGQNAREEINILSPEVYATNGGVPNYGWSFREGRIAFPNGPGGAVPPPGFSAIEPIHDYEHNLGRSVTGGLVYRGSSYPELRGAYLFGDYVSGNIWSMSDPGGPGQSVSQLAVRTRIAAFGIDPASGEVLLAHDNSNRVADDPVYRLVRSDGAGTPPPHLLSQTGAFRSLATLEPEDGIVAYEVNAPFWSDHALKRRWFSIPDPSARMVWSRDAPWSFPAGQIWIKHFDLDLDRDSPGAQRVRLETRFLVKTADDVYGITYRWNEAQTEAHLVGEEGESADYTVVEGGVARTQTWRFPSRTDCRTCHNPAAGWALGFDTRQLNRNIDYGGEPLDQLAVLGDAGYFETSPPSSADLPAHAPPQDPSHPLEARVRSYLAANCAACHRLGGTALGSWSAQPEIPLAASGLLDSPLVNNAGDPHNRTVVLGDPERSMILRRIALPRGAGGILTQMPPLASNEIDLDGAALLEAWISANPAPAPPLGGLEATDGTRADRIEISWQTAEDAVFLVYRGTDDDFASASLVHTGEAAYHHDGPDSTEAGRSYRYWVSALRDGSASPPAGPVVGRRALLTPGDPEATTDAALGGIMLSWPSSPDATAYRILRHNVDEVADATEVGVSDSANWIDVSAEPGIDYFYWIVATNAFGASGATAAAAGRSLLVQRQADLAVGRTPVQRIGQNVHQGAPGQTIVVASRRRRPMRAFYHLHNAGNVEDRYRLAAFQSRAPFRIVYLRRLPTPANLTPQLVGGVHLTGPLAPGDLLSGEIRIRPFRLRRSPRAHRVRLSIDAFSNTDPRRFDRVRIHAISRR